MSLCKQLTLEAISSLVQCLVHSDCWHREDDRRPEGRMTLAHQEQPLHGHI